MIAVRPRQRGILAVLVLAVLLALGLATNAMASYGHHGHGSGELYTQTNDPAGNAVQRFLRGPDGSLAAGGTVATGGLGLATLGGRQGAVERTEDGRYLLAVNAGSDTLAVLRLGRAHGPWLVGTYATLGSAPASVDERHGRVYVLNSGGPVPSVAAFRLPPGGRLRPIGVRPLAPGADGAAQVSVTPDGRALVVSERVSNRLELLALDRAGRPGAPVVVPSNGAVPFGFAITRDGVGIVSEAGASTVSSYRADPTGTVRVVTASLPVGQGAACWVAVTPDGRFAYTGNAAGSISGFAVASDGTLSALDADGLTAALDPSPRDLAVDPSGRYLLAVSPGAAGAAAGQVTSYRIGSDGSLTLAGTAPSAPGITGAAVS